MGVVNLRIHAESANMATQSITSSPARQAVFAQEKLERIYTRTYGWLRPHRGAIETLQEVLVWKKPVASAVLYIVIHWLFIIYVKSNATLITTIGNLIFWALLADILWRAASKDGFGEGGTMGGARWSEGMGGRRGSERVVRMDVTPRLETVLIQSHRPRGPGELPSFEVVCLWVSESVMWMDNLLLAFRHWSVNEPLIFTCGLALPGLVLSLIGKYIPTTVFLYLQVMVLLVWPYVEHHCLRQRTLAYISEQYPGVIRKAHSAWHFLKAITVNRDRSEDPELSLAQGGTELQTQASLAAEFEQAIAPPRQEENDELELLPLSGHGGEGGVTVDQSPFRVETRRNPQLRHTPQISSQDSLTLDSFVSGGDFPSISELDSSLALPPFNSGELGSIMPTISEQEELPATQNTREPDPYLDLDFQGPSVPSSHRPPQSSHPLTETRRANPINAQPSAPPMTSGFDNLGLSMYTTSMSTSQSGFTSLASEQRRYTSDFVPPPTYDQVATGSPEAGIVLTPGTREGLVPQESSTPNLQDEGEQWIRKRPSY